MWHGRRRSRLGLETEHRLSLIRNLAKELVSHQRVITTRTRAKQAAQFTEKLITIAKKNTLHSRRELITKLGSGTESIAKRLIEVVAPKFSDRKGGYTRILQYKFRQGDGAQLALLEFSTPIEIIQKKPRKKKAIKPEHEHHEHEHEHKEETRKSAKEVKEEKKKSVKGEEASKDAPKKGGFLKGLRKFLTGKDE